MTIRSTLENHTITVSIPKSFSIREAFLHNKTTCIITMLAFVALGISIGAPIGAAVYNSITGAHFANCSYP